MGNRWGDDDGEWGEKWRRSYGILLLALLCVALAASTVLLMIARAERLDDGTVKVRTSTTKESGQ